MIDTAHLRELHCTGFLSGKPLRDDQAIAARDSLTVGRFCALLDQLDAQAAEIERMRVALSAIASCEVHYGNDVVSVARQALQGEGL
jgi:hypothetical protein